MLCRFIQARPSLEDSLILMVSSSGPNKLPLALHLVQLHKLSSSGEDRHPEDSSTYHQDSKVDFQLNSKVDLVQHLSNKDLVLLNKLKVDSHQDSKVDFQLNSKVDFQLNSKVDFQLNSKVDFQLNSKVDFQLNSKVDLQLNSKVDSQLNRKEDSHQDSKVDLVQHLSNKDLVLLNKLKVDSLKVASVASNNLSKLVLELLLHLILGAFHNNKHLGARKPRPRINGTLRLDQVKPELPLSPLQVGAPV